MHHWTLEVIYTDLRVEKKYNRKVGSKERVKNILWSVITSQLFWGPTFFHILYRYFVIVVIVIIIYNLGMFLGMTFIVTLSEHGQKNDPQWTMPWGTMREVSGGPFISSAFYPLGSFWMWFAASCGKYLCSIHKTYLFLLYVRS